MTPKFGTLDLPCAVGTNLMVIHGIGAVSDPTARCRITMKKDVAWLTPDQLDSFIDLLIGVRSDIHNSGYQKP